jgi:hypothetical protein
VGFMNARRLILAALASLLPFTAGALVAAPVALAEETCANAASRQGPSLALPDCRVYEQVTPVDKGDSSDLFGNPAEEGNTAVAPSEDGNHLLFFTEAAFAGGDAYFTGYVFSRGAEGWTTTSLSPGPGVYRQAASIFDPENLSEVGVLNGLHLHAFDEEAQSQVVGPPGGPYTTFPTGSRPAGSSANLSHIVLESTNHTLAPGDEAQDEESPALYEWVGGHMQLVNVAADGALLSQCGATLGMESREAEYDVMSSAVSRDGSKLVFTAPSPEFPESYGGAAAHGTGCWNGWNDNLTQEENEKGQENAPQLYMRIGGTKTVEISAPNSNAHMSGPAQPAVFVGASADDSKVFFVSRAQLTADDTTHATQLYEYDAEAPEGERLIRVSRGESGTAEGSIDYVGAVSSDGSAVYFEASSKLAEGAPPAGGLYLYTTVTGKTTFIAPNAPYPFFKGDEQFLAAASWYDGYIGWSNIEGSEHSPEVAEQVALQREARWYVTGNGEYLLFPMEQEGQEELFRYSAADNSMVCVSCANGALAIKPSFGSGFPTESAPPTRPMSEDGEYVFFQTHAALVPTTTDQTEHVYEWHDGKVSLISSPDDPSNAYFLGTSADGSNAFFGTHAQLAPQDTDFSGDIYDARVDGGFVGITPAQCTGTGCQGVAAAPPIFATPASVTFEGVGNFPAGSGTRATTKPKPKIKKKALTRAQKLERALRTCARGHAKRKRGRCAARARAQYGHARKSTKSNGTGKGSN